MKVARLTKRVVAILCITLQLGCSSLQLAEVATAPKSNAKLVVFDIDGTLTPNVHSIWTMRSFADKSVQAYADKGYQILYLSTRIWGFQAQIPNWLKANNFPQGFLQVAQNLEDLIDHAAYKSRVLQEYKAKGWSIAYAYGDSPTDFVAYENAKVEKSRVFALQRSSETKCLSEAQIVCLLGWAEHQIFLANVPNAN